MKLALTLLIAFALAQDLPLKPKEEFEIKLNYQFKNRPTPDLSTVRLDETREERDRRISTTPLPFLILNIKMLKLSQDEVKVRISNNLTNRVITQKVEAGTIIPLEIGFTDDAKDRITPHQYFITTLSPKKTETNKIEIVIEEDGTFLVNGEKRGKF
jgi:hypothetical protein